MTAWLGCCILRCTGQYIQAWHNSKKKKCEQLQICCAIAPVYLRHACKSLEPLPLQKKYPDGSKDAHVSFIVRACGIGDPPETWSGVSTGTEQLVGQVLEPGSELCPGRSRRKEHMNN